MTDHKSHVAETPDEDPRGSDDFEDQWNDLDEKVILVQILTELQQIRLLLSQADSGASDASEDKDTYQCQRCPETVPADARERHARSAHKAPPETVDGMFEVVE